MQTQKQTATVDDETAMPSEMPATMAKTNAAYVRPLFAARRPDIARVGSKAAHLGELIAAGFSVPDGIVVTTDAFAEAIERLGSPPSREAILAAPLPAEIGAAVRAALGELAQVAVAVRSSSVAEDRADASFAGQYDTVLDVCGAEAVLEAVRRCWASAYSPRAVAYRQRHGGEAGAMAVIVQRLVRAEVAGVCFSANPVSGNRSEAVINAVRGLGEQLVAGEVTPDEWLVRDDEPRCTAAPEGALDPTRAHEIAKLARAVERHFQAPQDIEWAYAGGELKLLQARPITTLPEAPADEAVTPIPIPIEIPEGYWQRDAARGPKGGTPLFWTLMDPIIREVNPRVFAESGFLIEDVEIRPIGGLMYARMVPLGGKERKPPPAWLMPILRRIVPSLRRRIARSVELVRTDGFQRRLERWPNEWRPAMERRIAAFREVDLDALSIAELLAHFDEARLIFAEALEIHTRVAMSLNVVLGRFAFCAERLLGWDTERVLGLFCGLSETSSEPGRALVPLLEMSRQSSAIRSALDDQDAGSSEWTEQLQSSAPEFAAAWKRYLHRYGCRAIRCEICDPNLDETPEVMIGVLRGMLERGYDPEAVAAETARDRAEQLAVARAALDRCSEEEREEFEQRLRAAELAYGLREENQFVTFSCPVGLLRMVAIECGSRLADAGVVDRRDDVFFLEVDELYAALREGGSFDEAIALRKGQYAWANQRAGSEPMSYGTPPAPPEDLGWLPAEAAEVMRAVIWCGTHVLASPEAVGDGLSGIAAGAGTYEGVVRVIRDETQFSKLRAGDVLVCPITSPVWSVLFPNVGALVTDTGGLLSHSAIIAREFGIPAVVGTGTATDVLEDGQRVRVDGSAGRIEVLS